MQEHSKLSDKEFASQLENCSLDLSVFSHQAHLRYAWLNIERYGLEQAVEEVRTKLKKYIFSLGEDCKYNETVTIAAVHVVHRFKEASSTDNFADFITENSKLETNFKELLLSNYRTDIFESTLAKKRYLAPEVGEL